ncbi:family 16 glycosylhydrolase [Aurantimonas sp. Leaf443]|uniref:family 16 glycosylhydrolase n=1 Tax=Aurantimonas sp. Leaf443 TaxID=1736378 RepID=UPI0006F7636C|nr:family 16 glycosylhydrolase [Aurantimonas sp. Leaf443]KQT83485.1 hypothetical protein ASG48_13110 [Aurantimonas sp. Leaf443]
MGIDLSKYTSVLNETFDAGLNIYDGTKGIWSTGPRYDQLVTNSPKSVFLSSQTKTSDGTGVGLDPLSVSNGVLKIGSGIIPDADRAAVIDALKLADQGRYASTVDYYTGMIATDQTWGQSYGYYEITAQIPVGKGHWPAFWMAPATVGWPPEIDIFEAYGKGIGEKTGSDNGFNTAVFFDRYDVNGNPTQSVDITNPYATDADGTPQDAVLREKNGSQQHWLGAKHDALRDFGADIYSGFWTWSVEWTPETITFYFGRDAASLVEIYKTVTPPDVTSDMYVIANDQIGSTFGWDPVEGLDDRTFAKGNEFKIDSIRIFALNPEETLRGAGAGATLIDGDGGTEIVGTAGNDRIVTGDGQDIVKLVGGADTVFVERGHGNKIVTGFNGNDRIVLEGFFFDGVGEVMQRLTQQGTDVWLTNGADPADPQTILFKTTKVANFQPDDFVVRWSVTKNVWSSATVDGTRLADLDSNGIVKATDEGSKLTDVGGVFLGPKMLIGGAAGDLFFVYNSLTKVVEKASGGVDTVNAGRSYALSDHLENLVSLGYVDGQTFAGNAMGNRLEGTARAETFVGGKGDDLFLPGEGADRFVYRAGDGHDTIRGFGRDDVLAFDDLRFASLAEFRSRLVASGSDTIVDLGAGQSILLEGVAPSALGAFNVSFEIGRSTLIGRALDKNLVPSAGGPTASTVLSSSDDLDRASDIGGSGLPDRLAGSEADDRLEGQAGSDTLVGRGGDDVLSGGAGDDILFAGSGDDLLLGGAGDDVLNGGGGRDRLDGGSGADKLVGGEGATIFVLADMPRDGEIDRILDLDRRDGDRIDLSDLFPITVSDALVEDYVRLGERGGFVTLEVDRDGSGRAHAFQSIALVEGGTVSEILSALIL